MFLRSLVKLPKFCPQIQVKTKEKGLRRILVLTQSVISDFLLPSGYCLPKNRGGQTYFAPFSVRSKGMPAPQN